MMALVIAAPLAAGASVSPIDSGSTAWMLTSSALVLLMVPGLALFYGGMVRRKNILTTMLHSFIAMALIGVQWVLVGYALAFGRSQGGLIGWSWDAVGLHGLMPHQLFSDKAIPELAFVMFQGKFAIITPALISGAVAERVKFSTYVLFILLWATFIYCPLAHWVWAPGGWLFEYGVLDFAGGTVVHIAAGVSGLVLAIMTGPRRDYPHGAIMPNNLTLTLTGAGLLWFGWFGFNAGSEVEYFRGQPVRYRMVHKSQITIGVNDAYVEPAIRAIIEAARTADGEIGDGKIFVVPLEECVRIRTGERGGAAI